MSPTKEISRKLTKNSSVQRLDQPDSSNVNAVKIDGLVITVNKFIAEDFVFEGGEIPALPNGKWFVGIELSTKQLRLLPRLGHRGWIPVLYVETNATSVTKSYSIEPKLPTCRIPRTMTKVVSGKAIKVVVMGSSLTQSGGSSTDWAGMVFGTDKNCPYKVPVDCVTTFAGVGGSPNKYQFAQTGFASGHDGYGFSGTGYPKALFNKKPPNGRSAMFKDVDLVVIGCLANGGGYRLDVIEPTVRRLRKLGLEVIIATDNAQGPSTDYETLTNALLYVDFPTIYRVAEDYGVEIADTAAYVSEAYVRKGGVGIYGDVIHMANGLSIGPEHLIPANGHEAWARAVRSIFHITAPTTTLSGVPIIQSDFSAGKGTWISYGSPVSVGTSNGKLTIVSDSTFDGVQVNLGYIANGAIDIEFDIEMTPGMHIEVGCLGGESASWCTPTSATESTGHFKMTLNTVSPLQHFLAFINFGTTGTFSIDNVVVTAGSVSIGDLTSKLRKVEIKDIPPIRVVKDYKVPGDVFVILPEDERSIFLNAPDKGTLEAHPWGTASFAKKFYPGTNFDLLIVPTGKIAEISAECVVGFSLIHYREPSDGPCTIEIYCNNSLVNTVNIGTVPFGNEWYQELLNGDDLLVSKPDGSVMNAIELRVKTGTLKIAALTVLTADVDYIPNSEIKFVGPGWLPEELSRSGLPGLPTNTAGDKAYVRCPGRRLQWIVSGNPQTKPVNNWSGSEIAYNVEVGGNYHIWKTPAIYGPGEIHTIECAQSNPLGTQADGHALHVGGVIVINDR